MSFPFFLIVPALKLIGGLVQSLTQSRPADAPAAVVGGGPPSVEFQPMLQQMLGAQLIAQAAGQAPAPAVPSAGAPALAPSAASGGPAGSPIAPPPWIQPAQGDARAVPIVEIGAAANFSQPASAYAGFTSSGQALVEPGSPSLLATAPAATSQRTTASAGLIDPGGSPAAFTVYAPERPFESLVRASWIAEGRGVETQWAMKGELTAAGLMTDGASDRGPADTAPADPFVMRPDGIAHLGLSSSQSRSEAIDAAAPAAGPIHVDEAPRLADQLANSVRVNWDNGRSEARLALVPPDLGTVRVQMVMEHSSLSLTFTAGNEHARGLIESSLPRLKENLAEQGIDVGEMNVQVDLTERDPGRSFRAFDFDNVPPEIPQRLSTVAPFMIERPVPAISGLDLFA